MKLVTVTLSVRQTLQISLIKSLKWSARFSKDYIISIVSFLAMKRKNSFFFYIFFNATYIFKYIFLLVAILLLNSIAVFHWWHSCFLPLDYLYSPMAVIRRIVFSDLGRYQVYSQLVVRVILKAKEAKSRIPMNANLVLRARAEGQNSKIQMDSNLVVPLILDVGQEDLKIPMSSS